MSGQCSKSYSLVLGSPARNMESDLIGPFSLEVFDDSMILCKEFCLQFLSDPQSIRKEFNENKFLKPTSISPHSSCKIFSLYVTIDYLLLSYVKEYIL